MTEQSFGPDPAPADGAPVDQPSAAPTSKWVAGVGAGSGTILVLWVASLLGLELTPEVASALTLVAAGVAGYFKRNRATVLEVLDRGRGLHLDRDGDGRADR